MVIGGNTILTELKAPKHLIELLIQLKNNCFRVTTQPILLAEHSSSGEGVGGLCGGEAATQTPRFPGSLSSYIFSMLCGLMIYPK